MQPSEGVHKDPSQEATLFPKMRLRERTQAGLFSRRPPTNPEALSQIRVIQARAAEPLVGIVAPGGRTPGLFPLNTTGVDTASITAAACDYLAALSDTELADGRFPIDDQSWRHWANPAAFLVRHGLLMETLSDRKRELVFKLIGRSLSDEGFRLVVDCMHLNLTTGEIRGETDELNEWLYWFSVYGSPETGGPWGWQLDGHHVNVNCVIVGDQLVSTPLFLGAEPPWADSGKYAGTSVLRPEQAVAEQLFNALTPNQQAEATIATELPADLFTAATRDNFELSYAGLPLSAMTEDQRSIAIELLRIYINRAAAGHAEVKLSEVMEHLPETYLAWIGGSGPGDVYYYRLHSPVILIEFEHQAGVMFDDVEPTRHHIHTLVRTPNGNDYGAALLRQHYGPDEC